MRGPVALTDEQEPTGDDQNRSADQPGVQRLVQEHERDRDREERRRADDDGRPRRAGFSHGKREEELRETGAEQTGE